MLLLLYISTVATCNFPVLAPAPAVDFSDGKSISWMVSAGGFIA